MGWKRSGGEGGDGRHRIRGKIKGGETNTGEEGDIPKSGHNLLEKVLAQISSE